VRRERRWFPVGASPTRQLVVPAGSNRSGGGGNETVEAFDGKDRVSDSASQQAVTRVNAEQASKRVMWEPTRLNNGEGRRRGVQRVSPEEGKRTNDKIPRSHRGNGDGMLTRKPGATRETPAVRARNPQLDAREGQAGPRGVTERLVVATKPGNAGGAKGPRFKDNATSTAGPGDWR
jgi:hypothetical protein